MFCHVLRLFDDEAFSTSSLFLQSLYCSQTRRPQHLPFALTRRLLSCIETVAPSLSALNAPLYLSRSLSKPSAGSYLPTFPRSLATPTLSSHHYLRLSRPSRSPGFSSPSCLHDLRKCQLPCSNDVPCLPAGCLRRSHHQCRPLRPCRGTPVPSRRERRPHHLHLPLHPFHFFLGPSFLQRWSPNFASSKRACTVVSASVSRSVSFPP